MALILADQLTPLQAALVGLGWVGYNGGLCASFLALPNNPQHVMLSDSFSKQKAPEVDQTTAIELSQ